MLSFNKTLFKILIGFTALLTVACASAVGVNAGETAGGSGGESGVVDVSALNMRDCPGTDCEIVMVLNRGDRLRITGEAGDWLEVRYNGTTGYVYGGSNYVWRVSEAMEDKADFADEDDAREKAAAIERRIAGRKADLSEIARRAAETAAALEDIDKEMADARERLAQTEEDLAAIEDRIADRNAAISETRGMIEEKKDYAEKRLVSLYKLNRLGGMNLLATADSASDLFRRKAAMEAVLAHDEKVISQLVAEEERLEDLLEQAAREKDRQKELVNRSRQTRAELAEKKEKRRHLLAEIKAEQSKAQSEVEHLEQAARRLQEAIDELERRAVEPGPDEKKAFSQYQGLLKAPVDGKIISRYGKYTDPYSGAASFRNGIEIEAASGAPVKAVFGGETGYSDWLTGFGRVIIVSHGNSYYTVYGHLEELLVDEGDRVKAGEVIGTAGDSGRGSGSSGGPALYFEVRHKGTPQDPLDWIEKD